MDSDVVLEIDKKSKSGSRTKIAHKPPRTRSKVDEKDIKALLKNRYRNLRTVNAELSLSGSCSPCRKSMPARFHSVSTKNSEVANGGSVYQSSKEKRNIQTLRHGTRNVEPSFNDESFLSFEIVDPSPLPSSKSKRSTLMPLDSASESSAKPKELLESCSRDLPKDRIKYGNTCSGSSRANDKIKHNSENNVKGLAKEQKSNTNRCNLSKSFSANDVMFNPPCTHLEKEKIKASPKSRFSPFRKMFDPIMKSKSMRNPSCMETEVGGRPEVFQKSLLSDFSKATEGSTKGDKVPIVNSSPTHLHANLKFDCKHDAPSYEFAIEDLEEEFLLAKPWRTNSAFNWVYTFHNSKHKRRHKQSPPLIGQMQVSSSLCSEVCETGSLKTSIKSEYNLYDITQARKSLTNDFKCHRSTSFPLAHADLHSCLEIAAVVIKLHFNKKEMKELLIEEDNKAKAINLDCMNCASVKVVTTSGTHSLSCSEEGKPYSLLERWRFGGACDCGGWDMSCPIFVLDNQCDADVVDHSKMGSQRKVVLFVQGRKEKIPALSMTSDENGQYSVDFHVRLSALQAFSVCISIIHSSKAASALKNKSRLCSNSQKLLVNEEMWHRLDAVKEEKRKTKTSVEKIPASYILDPPFSPMGRV